MPAPTPGYVKNMIRRSFMEIVDPSPKEKDEQKIWNYFNSECAYCGRKLNKVLKEGHIDHLVPASFGGSNNISNRVLSCANCDEKEKLDKPWKNFLLQKNSDKSIASRRKDRILEWMSMSETVSKKQETVDMINKLSKEVVDFYDEMVKMARQLRNL